MKPKLILGLAFVLGGVLTGCVATSTKPLDVRAALLESAKKSEPDFPDGRDLVLAHFAEIGQLVTLRGDVIYVIEQFSVTPMQCLRTAKVLLSSLTKSFNFSAKLVSARATHFGAKEANSTCGAI
jgi:hypothetical protein